MIPVRSMVLIAGLSLIAATLAIVAHDVRLSLQLGRMLARSRNGHAVRALVKDSTEMSAEDVRKRRARRLAQLDEKDLRATRVPAASGEAFPGMGTADAKRLH